MKHTLAILLVLFTFSSCSVVQQIQQVKNLGSCEFKLHDVQDVRLAGVSIQNKNGSTELSITDGARLAAALASNTLPLTFDLNLDVHNPNGQAAGLNRLDWILFIDDIEMVSGVNEAPVMIPSNGNAIIPLKMNIDLRKALAGKGGQSLMNFGFNLAGANGQPTRIKLKAKPTILIGNFPVAYPGYITISSAVK
ncbi:MAG: hypothetical protein Q8908_00530 [Bacteroidota bacterium]|nr:hypothetical protein [Bacteroidota bacterium]